MKIISLLLGACMFVATGLAKAAVIDVNGTTSGSSGSWIADFSVTNNLGGSNVIYFFGIQAPTNNVVNSPPYWNSTDWTNWNMIQFGGSNTIYNNNWIWGTINPGQTTSGFQVMYNTIAPPINVSWFAFSYQGYYCDSSGVNCSWNPGFEGVTSMIGPVEAGTGVGPVETATAVRPAEGMAGSIIAPVPEPETYAMLLLGLGMIGFITRGRAKSMGHHLLADLR
jgi:hypothetical protein